MYKYINHPQQIPQSEYDVQEKQLTDFLLECTGIISLYRIGELGLLGVSDLDYLIIYDGSVDKKSIEEFCAEHSLLDTVLFLDVKNIHQKNYLSHHKDYTYVFGKDLGLAFDTTNKNLNIIYAWRVCFFSLLRNFYMYKYTQTISVKPLLSQINDIRYPMYFLGNLGIDKAIYNDFLMRYGKYREEYFSHKNYEKLEEFLHEAIDISWDIVHELHSVLPTQADGKSYIYGRFPTVFYNFETNTAYRKYSENALKYTGKFSRILFLPVSFDYRVWEGELQKDFNNIRKNNSGFLNFSLPSKRLRIILFFKKCFDSIFLRTLYGKK